MDRADWFEAIWSWAKAILLVAFFGAIIWLTLAQGSEEPPSYFELQAAVAASQTCDELTAAHDSALRTHENEAIDDQQMNTLWNRVLDRAEVLQPNGDLTTHLKCTGLIGRCPRGTPADICNDLLSDDF